jgi:hypothetical protein
MTRSEALHNMHSPKGHCANCASELPSGTQDALCTNCANVQKVRSLLSRHDPALLAFCDAAKNRCDARLTGLKVQTELGWQGIGELGPKPEPKP